MAVELEQKLVRSRSDAEVQAIMMEEEHKAAAAGNIVAPQWYRDAQNERLSRRHVAGCCSGLTCSPTQPFDDPFGRMLIVLV